MKDQSYEKIRCWSTSITVEKSMMEIEKMLSTHKARAIMKEYDGTGNPIALMFKIETEVGDMPIKLPVRPQAVSQILNQYVKEGKIPRKYLNDLEQARRVSWRLIRDWLYSQLSLLDVRMVKIQEIFLPYAYDARTGQTLFEKFEERKFAGMLEAPQEEGVEPQ